jgi:beta-alanine--pyruvate transaminase
VAALAPAGMNKVFFTNSGSEAVETALKMAIAYHRARGEGTRTRLIGRERGYHGVGFGGISVGGMVANRKMFGTLLPGVDHIRHTHDRRATPSPWASRSTAPNSPTTSSAWCALHDASTIAAVIVEPMRARPACCCRPRATCSACARSATSTASC